MMKFACTCPSLISDLSHASISPCFATTWPRFTKPFLLASFQSFPALGFNVFCIRFECRSCHVPASPALLAFKNSVEDSSFGPLPDGAAQSCRRVLFRCAFHLTHLQRSRTESDLWPLSQ